MPKLFMFRGVHDSPGTARVMLCHSRNDSRNANLTLPVGANRRIITALKEGERVSCFAIVQSLAYRARPFVSQGDHYRSITERTECKCSRRRVQVGDLQKRTCLFLLLDKSVMTYTRTKFIAKMMSSRIFFSGVHQTREDRWRKPE